MKSPKWVPKANMWCVTYFKEGSGKGAQKITIQVIEWFVTKEEAEEFFNETGRI